MMLPAIFLSLTLGAPPDAAPAINDGLDEVNAKRAARGLPPFQRDYNLTLAAHGAASYRASYRMFGHVTGGIGDFQFLPAGAKADAAGCAAYPMQDGWLSCCTYDSATYAGAAWVTGADNKRYMHLFISNTSSAPVVNGTSVIVAATTGVVVTAAAPATTSYTYRERTVYRGRFRQPTVTYELAPCAPVPAPVPTAPPVVPQPMPPKAESPAPVTLYAAPTACGSGQCQSPGRTVVRSRLFIRSR